VKHRVAVAALVFWVKVLMAQAAFLAVVLLMAAVVVPMVIMAPLVMVPQQRVALVVFMAAAVVVAHLMVVGLEPLVRFVLFGLAQHARSHQQIRVICNELVHSLKKWATV
jgi:hypothetical protein